MVGGGAAGGREEEALGLPTCGRGGVAVDIRDEDGEVEAAYGCTEGATGVRGEYPLDEAEVSMENMAVPMASISSELSARSILGMSDESRPSSEYSLVYLDECEDSDVGDVDVGDEGVVDAVDTDTEDDAYVDGGEVAGRGIL